jgi:hypothetical protein
MQMDWWYLVCYLVFFLLVADAGAGQFQVFGGFDVQAFLENFLRTDSHKTGRQCANRSDINCDGRTDFVDYSLWLRRTGDNWTLTTRIKRPIDLRRFCRVWLQADFRCDLNGDGIVNFTDYALWAK